MNSFRTEVFPEKPGFKINHHTPILLLGSCFANNIGELLSNHEFQTCVNPFGVLYNPLTIINGIGLLLENKTYKHDDLGFHNNVWYSFDHYTAFSHHDKATCLQKINEESTIASGFLAKTRILIITLGTSWAFRYKKTGKIVANCHKNPAREFDRFFISGDDIVMNFEKTLNELKRKIPDLEVIFTVSPIRHWKDGAAGNQYSKSNLIMAVHQFTEKLKFATYFPSYEIMMDDLRDYRFYEEDMVHPNKMAIKYIWQKFMDTFMEDQSLQIIEKMEKINQALNHRPSNPKSDDYIQFVKSHIKKVEDLEKKYNINLGKTIHEFNNRLK